MALGVCVSRNRQQSAKILGFCAGTPRFPPTGSVNKLYYHADRNNAPYTSVRRLLEASSVYITSTEYYLNVVGNVL